MSLLGACEPRHLMPANSSNPKGYWESVLLMKFHDGLLHAYGSAWDDWSRLPDRWCDSPAARELRKRIPAVLEEEFGDAPLILLKDPRLCRLIPLWDLALREQNIDPLVVFTVRNALEVAGSLRARDGFDRRRSLLLWLRHVLDAERDTRSLRRTFVRYGDMLEDWRSAVARISTDLHVDWPRRPESAADGIDHLLDNSLRHHQAEHEMPQGGKDDLLGSWVADTSNALETLCQPGADSREALATLDRVRDEFDLSAAAFRDALRDEIHQLRAAVFDTRTELAALDAVDDGRLRQATAELEQVNGALHAGWQELEGAARELQADLRARLERVDGALQAEREELAIAALELRVATTAGLDQAGVALEAEREELAAISREVRVAVKAGLQQIRGALHAEREEAAAAQELHAATAAALKQANDVLQAQLQEAAAARESQAASKAELESRLEVAHRGAEERVEELAKLTRRMLKAEARVGSIKEGNKRRVARLEGRIERQQRHLAEMSGELAAMRESRSWRVTAPMRNLTSRARAVSPVASSRTQQDRGL